MLLPVFYHYCVLPHDSILTYSRHELLQVAQKLLPHPRKEHQVLRFPTKKNKIRVALFIYVADVHLNS